MEFTFHIFSVEITSGVYKAANTVGASVSLTYQRNPWAIILDFQPLFPVQFELEVGRRL